MARVLKKVCRQRGCNNSTRNTYCEEHSSDKERHRRYDNTRPNSHQRGYTKKWSNLRKLWLQDHPLCVSCGRGATEVDHIRPHRGDSNLFWDTSNLQSMCKSCHSAKTRIEVNERTRPCKKR